MQLRNYVVFLISLLVMLMLWEYLPQAFNIPVYIFPPISKIYISIVDNFDNVRNHFSVTIAEAILGFLMGSVIGFLFGVIIAEFSLISKISLPYLIASNAIPVIAIAPMIILWFGYGIMAKVIVSAFVCFFPLVITTYKGLNEYKIVFAELFKIYGSNKYEFLIKYKLPNAIPFILSGLKLNATYSVVGAVVAEFIGANSGLGFGMLQSIYSMNTARLWGYIAISCSLGMMMYFFVYVFEITINKFMRYEKII